MSVIEPTRHPSTARREVRVAALCYGLIAAPTAWLMAQIFSATIAQQACFPHYAPLPTPAFAGAHAGPALALLLAAAISASGAYAAYRSWRSTRKEHTGDSDTLLEVGEGRSRFMALAGLLTSLGFLVACLFSVPAVVLVPVC